MATLQEEISDLNYFLSTVDTQRYNINATEQDEIRNAAGYGGIQSTVINQTNAARTQLDTQVKAAQDRLAQIQIEIQNQIEKAKFTIMPDDIQNNTINQVGQQIEKSGTQGLILFAGLVAAALILK